MHRYPRISSLTQSKTNRASFRHTVSTFRDTAQEWSNTV
jgi:hypothetical protein